MPKIVFWDSQKRQRSVSPQPGKDSDGEISRRSPPQKKAEEIPSIQSIKELILRQIEEAKLNSFREPNVTTTRESDSPLSKDILTCKFLKKFITLTVDPYTGVSDLMQHL